MKPGFILPKKTKLTNDLTFGKHSKIIFAGTPEFAVPSLSTLIEKGYFICAVYTKPDRPAGRGRQLTQSPIKNLALSNHIPVYQPATLRDLQTQQTFANLKPDLMIVAAYGLILPVNILQIPKWGCINIHASLLPRWRGASPIQHAILSGDNETGITIMQMDAGLDTGEILYQQFCAIEKKDTAQTLQTRLADLGGQALVDSLELLSKDLLSPVQQNEDAATYAHKINKEDGKIDWNQSVFSIERKIRAFNPWPVAFTYLDHKMIRIWDAEILDEPNHSAKPGTILNKSKLGIEVATIDRILRLTLLQLPNSKILPVRDILNAHKTLFLPGTVFGN